MNKSNSELSVLSTAVVIVVVVVVIAVVVVVVVRLSGASSPATIERTR